MTVGQVVDYCIEWNQIHGHDMDGSGSDSEKGKKQKEVIKRKATQADWDALMG